MKKKLLSALIMILALSSFLSFSSFARSWRRDDKGWWYSYKNGSYPTSKWLLIDGDWYLFDSVGYIYTKTFTHDGYYVDPNGRYIDHLFKYSLANEEYKFETISVDMAMPVDSSLFDVIIFIDGKLKWRGTEEYMEKLPDGRIKIRINARDEYADEEYKKHLDIVVDTKNNGKSIEILSNYIPQARYDK